MEEDAYHHSNQHLDHVAVLDRLRSPVLLLDSNRRILFQNLAARRLVEKTPRRKSVEHAVLRSVHKRSRELELDPQRSLSQVVRLSGRNRLGPWIAVVTPLPGADLVYLVRLIGQVNEQPAPRGVLAELFSITPKEAAVIDGLLQRLPLQGIAERLNISRDAVKARLKQIFRKCGVRSRIELLTLVQRMALLHP